MKNQVRCDTWVFIMLGVCAIKLPGSTTETLRDMFYVLSF